MPGMWFLAQLITVQREKKNSSLSQWANPTHPSTGLKPALSKQRDALNRASLDSTAGLAPPVMSLVMFPEASPQHISSRLEVSCLEPGRFVCFLDFG